MQKGKLYLIPNTLGGTDVSAVLPSGNTEIIHSIGHFITESEKSAKALLKRIAYPRQFNDISFYLLNEHTAAAEIPSFLEPLLNGQDMGLLSDAGCPAIADPGAEVVRLCHNKGIKVVPLTGPSSIILSLMGSGLNGQTFTFRGYLPYEKDKRTAMVREMERLGSSGNTQIFIEAPYRNRNLLQELIEICKPETRICVACDLTLESELLVTRTAAAWKTQLPDIHKRPCIFLLGR